VQGAGCNLLAVGGDDADVVRVDLVVGTGQEALDEVADLHRRRWTVESVGCRV
jgi:hypothetical protein